MGSRLSDPPPIIMLIHFLLLLLGLVILYYGAEFLVEGASKIAMAFGISPLIVGLTVVGFATSAPEFVVSLLATMEGASDLAVGNVIGSNIANIALVGGLSALVFPMAVERKVMVRDYPVMLIASVAVFFFASTGLVIAGYEGFVLLAILFAFLAMALRQAYHENKAYKQTGQHEAVSDEERPSMAVLSLKVVGGIAGLVIGAKLMVDHATEIARAMEVSELVIGVSVVAVGTSLPELATSLVAAFRKEADLSLGNIIGSNIFNLTFILGGVSLVGPIGVAEQALHFDFWVMLGVSLLLLPIGLSGLKIGRLEGAVLFLIYVAYLVTTYLVSIGQLAI